MNRTPLAWRTALSLVAVALASAGCGAGKQEQLEHRVEELEGELFDAKQRGEDLKARMDYIRSRNRVLVGLVEGLTSEPDHAPGKHEGKPMASATRALEALDKDIELLGVTLRESRKDVDELKGERTELQSNLGQAIARIEEAHRREARAQARLETFRSMLLQLRSMIDSKELELQIVRNQMVVKLPEAVLFDTGEAELKPGGRDVLGGLATVLKSITGREFQVAGHTDDVPIANWRYKTNWHLSAARAINVTRFLVKQGVEGARLSAVAFADTRPVATGKTEDARKKNRRIEIALMPALEELPDLAALDDLAREESGAAPTAGVPDDEPAASGAGAAPVEAKPAVAAEGAAASAPAAPVAPSEMPAGQPAPGESPAAAPAPTSPPAASPPATPAPAAPAPAPKTPAPVVAPRELPPGYSDPATP